ncbi:RAMP superfamily CRISPR-associated protein [Oscillatoria laete-virens NRMC-F 0139]|nr:RAMP superfamily CRISPR-associated protein [Oscillatoria laete-virens]MDL5054153.1 RAMP superfamily CRISPR-associated protein [Oscillatoria laete-virens NRMC-F 0139]
MKEWEEILKKLQKNKSPLYDLYKDSTIEVKEVITFYFLTEEAKQAAQSKWQNLRKYLPPHWQQKRINYEVGKSLSSTSTQTTGKKSSRQTEKRKTTSSPLQALNHTLFTDRPEPALQATVDAEASCTSLYRTLTQQTEMLATATVDVQFLWRVRVGGMRGFNELLLPVFHPVYGVPYIPASSLKGVVRNWARQHQSETQVQRLLGTLEQGVGCVQIFDAFPTKPCLNLDIATPQWSWNDTDVPYQPVPHVLLSMLEPAFKIGLAPTCRGNADDVAQVKEWVEKSLSLGIGSRVSSGYGRTTLTSGSSHSSKHPFQLWTQGIYGAIPPTRENQWQGQPEFRPTALRGVLRYWFRALGLSLYPTTQCQKLEAKLFGTITPQSCEGSFRIAADWIEDRGNRTNPHLYEGDIILEAQTAQHLQLLEKLLCLATHLGGVGRGSRRSLHWNEPHPGLRGCYWELDSLKLPYNKERWQEFFEGIHQSFRAIEQPQASPTIHSPGRAKHRQQDVLDRNACLFLVSSRGLKHPDEVRDWRVEGKDTSVRGEALDLLYSSDRFKGRNQQGQGNENVGGGLETPSFVTIQSNFPQEGTPYQAVTIFGANQRDRATFVQELRKLKPLQIL